MVNSKTFDLTVKAFGDLVTEVFSGTDESQKAKLRTKLNQFSKISKSKRKGREDLKSMTFLLSQWLFTGGKFQWLNFLLLKDSFLTFKDSFSSFSKLYFELNFNDSFSSFSSTLPKYQNCQWLYFPFLI